MKMDVIASDLALVGNQPGERETEVQDRMQGGPDYLGSLYLEDGLWSEERQQGEREREREKMKRERERGRERRENNHV
jgi:hypothetical protein